MQALSEQPISCPFCGERISIIVDHSLDDQQYVEDCEVCCQPILFSVSIDGDGDAAVTARCENE